MKGRIFAAGTPQIDFPVESDSGFGKHVYHLHKLGGHYFWSVMKSVTEEYLINNIDEKTILARPKDH